MAKRKFRLTLFKGSDVACPLPGFRKDFPLVSTVQKVYDNLADAIHDGETEWQHDNRTGYRIMSTDGELVFNRETTLGYTIHEASNKESRIIMDTMQSYKYIRDEFDGPYENRPTTIMKANGGKYVEV